MKKESNVQIFENLEFGSVRTIIIGNEPWFVASDIAKSLGYRMASDLTRRIDEEDKGTHLVSTPRGEQNMTVINESGLYEAILGSKITTAKKFKKWVTSEVLPSIRKHGMYAKDELLDNPDLLISVAQELKIERERNKILTADNERMKPKEIFADAVSASHTSILIGDLAKILKQNGVNTGSKRLFERLRNEGYLVKRQGSDWNMPTQKAMEMQLFEIKESTINNPDGSVRINRTTKVTGKGQQYFINKFLSC